MHQLVNQLQQLQHQMAQISQDIQSVQMKLNSVTSQAQQMQAQQQMQGQQPGTNYGTFTAPAYGQTYRTPAYGTSYQARPAQYGSIATGQAQTHTYTSGASAQASGQFSGQANTYGARVSGVAQDRVAVSGRQNSNFQATQQAGQSVNASVLQSVMNADAPARTQGVGRQSEQPSYGRMV